MRLTEDAVKSFKIDITSHEEVSKLFEAELKSVPLDLVIHSAGIRGLVNDGKTVGSYEGVKGMEIMDAMNAETMRKAFDVNVLGSFQLFRACVLGLKRAAANGNVPKVIVMGSRMGSIGNNQKGNANAGGAFAYRASKAGLNAVVRSFAVDVPEAIWTVVHPGRVETGLVRVKEDGAMTVDESVGDMVQLIEGLQLKDNGRFFDRFGVDIPW
jgi:NAD(P)-dependent dehydrogenase (short-subunit alcohol dehydrogenase family)